MNVKDAVAHAKLSVFTELALAVLLVVFVLLIVYLFVVRRRSPQWREQAALPLLDDETAIAPDIPSSTVSSTGAGVSETAATERT